MRHDIGVWSSHHQRFLVVGMLSPMNGCSSPFYRKINHGLTMAHISAWTLDWLGRGWGLKIFNVIKQADTKAIYVNIRVV